MAWPDLHLCGHWRPCPDCSGAGHILAFARDGWQPEPCPRACVAGRIPKPVAEIVADMIAETRTLEGQRPC